MNHRDAFLANGGDAGARILARDWSTHPLGPIAGWPASLRMSLGLVLGSSFPTFLAWGEELFVFHNDAYAPMLGNRSGAASGTPLPGVWPEIWDTLAPLARRVLDGEALYFENFQVTVERNGYPEQAWFTFSYSPLRDEAGAVRGLMCTVVEETDKVLALARHKEAEERYALSIEASGNIGTWTYELDTGATFVDEQFARLFQVDASLARAGTELERFTDMIHPDDRPRVVAAIAHAIATDTLYDIEYRIPQLSRADVWVNARGKVFHAPGGGRRRFAGVAVDITERKYGELAQVAAERAMKDSEARFRSIANLIPQLVWSAGAGGTNDYLNARWREFTGLPEQDLLGNGWVKIIHPDDMPVLDAAWDRSLATGTPYEVEHRLLHHTGQYRWVLNRALPVTGEHGAIVRWMGALTDIHDKKRGEEELKAAARRKDEFLAMLAHELRNPLAPISSAAQLLVHVAADERRVRQSSEIIVRQVRHLTGLVDDLLDVSRVTRGLVELQRERVDLKGVLASALEQARPLVEARRHRLDLALDAAPAWVDGDRIRLVQVVANLLNNAAKYTPQGGAIALSLEVDQGFASIAVCDNGIGISHDLLPQVFELFTQAERTPDRAQGGLGLGLALVKSLVGLHGGRVEAESGGPGLGSTFRVALPLARAERVAEPAGDDDAATGILPAAGSARTDVMIVDDNADAAQSLAEILRAVGHRVTVAHEPRGALALAEREWPDVFILDIGLPDIDGYALARRLRAMAEEKPRERAALYLALTGYGQAHDKVLSKAAGFDRHFVKPVDLEALQAALAGTSSSRS